MMGMLNINCHGASRHCRGRVADGWSASLPIEQCGFGLAASLYLVVSHGGRIERDVKKVATGWKT